MLDRKNFSASKHFRESIVKKFVLENAAGEQKAQTINSRMIPLTFQQLFCFRNWKKELF